MPTGLLNLFSTLAKLEETWLSISQAQVSQEVIPTINLKAIFSLFMAGYYGILGGFKAFYK